MKICDLEQLETLIKGVESLNNEQLKELFIVYPFEDMININIMNEELLMAQAALLLKLSNKNIFCQAVKPITHILQFSTSILSSMETAGSSDLLSIFLELLKVIISKCKHNDTARDLIQKTRERILDVVTKSTKLKFFEATHVSDCTQILIDLISMNGVLPVTTSRNMAEIAEVFKGLKVVHELAVISNIVLKKFSISTEVFGVCIPWLLIYGPIFLREGSEENTINELMTAMNEFYNKYSYVKNTKRHQNSNLVKNLQTFIDALSHIADKILVFSEKPALHEESVKLFSLILSESNGQKWDASMRELKELPSDIREWPKSKSATFFNVCSFLCKYARPIWPSPDILRSIANLIYSYNRFHLNATTLKSICFVYSVLAVDSPGKECFLLGDELSIIMSKRFYELSEIYTCHAAQLCWILQCGDGALKKNALCHWLRHSEDLEVTKRCVAACGAGVILLKIITDRHVDEDISDRAIQLIHSLHDQSISATIAMMVCVTYSDPKLIRRLMLSNPGVPKDRDSALKICQFLSLLLPSIEDETVFASACAYSKNLVVILKTETDIVKVFCNDIRNVKFLLLKLKRVKDETAVEVLGLLKVLVLVQKRNHTHLEDKLAADLAPSLLGSSNKMEKCLDLLHLVVSRDLFIHLSPLKIQIVFLKLFDLYSRPELRVKCLSCMTEILKANQWLAFMSSTNLFVEVNCGLEVEVSSWQEFVVFLEYWLKILKRARGKEATCVAHVGIVRNYLCRVPYLPQAKRNHMLTTLKKVDKLNPMRINLLL